MVIIFTFSAIDRRLVSYKVYDSKSAINTILNIYYIHEAQSSTEKIGLFLMVKEENKCFKIKNNVMLQRE